MIINYSFFIGEPSIDYLSTFLINNYYKSFQLSDGSFINCIFYDTPGQERFRPICETYYKKVDAVLLVYDISNKASFEEIQNYYCIKIRELCNIDIPIILVGNKTDKEYEREIKTEEGLYLANKENFLFIETSCLKNENVTEAFEMLIETWKDRKILSEMRMSNIKLKPRKKSIVSKCL